MPPEITNNLPYTPLGPASENGNLLKNPPEAVLKNAQLRGVPLRDTSAINSSQGILNELAEEVLERFDRFGGWVQATFDAVDLTPEQTFASTITQVPAIQEALDTSHKSRILRTTKQLGWDAGFIDRHFPSEFKPSNAVKVLSYAGSIMDSVSGVLSIASAFHNDRKAGDRSYQGTMIQTAKSVGQLGIGYAAGALAAGAVATGASIGLPIVIGVAAATGAGYLFGRAVDWITGE